MGYMQIVSRTHDSMMCKRMVLGEVVRVVYNTRCSVYVEVSMSYSVLNPIEAHVY